jgi:hypothetical protein
MLSRRRFLASIVAGCGLAIVGRFPEPELPDTQVLAAATLAASSACGDTAPILDFTVPLAWSESDVSPYPEFWITHRNGSEWSPLTEGKEAL